MISSTRPSPLSHAVFAVFACLLLSLLTLSLSGTVAEARDDNILGRCDAETRRPQILSQIALPVRNWVMEVCWPQGQSLMGRIPGNPGFIWTGPDGQAPFIMTSNPSFSESLIASDGHSAVMNDGRSVEDYYFTRASVRRLDKKTAEAFTNLARFSAAQHDYKGAIQPDSVWLLLIESNSGIRTPMLFLVSDGVPRQLLTCWADCNIVVLSIIRSVS